MLEKVNEAVASLKAHWRKYGIIAIAALFALVGVFKRVSRMVHTQDLVSQSILRYAGWDVSKDRQSAGARKKKGGKTPRNGAVSGNVAQPYLPPEATIELTPVDPQKQLSDVVNIKVRNTWGFTREPGLDLSAAPLGIGLDFKWFYAYKFGTEVGVEEYFYPVRSFSPTLGLSYRLDRFAMLRNTELKLSYAPLSVLQASAGIRVNF